MKKEMIFEDRSGDKDSVFLYVNRYYSNKSFYVGLSSIIDGGPDYGDLTICLPQYKLGRTTAAINGDSTEEILRFIEKYKLGEILPDSVRSGFATYRLVDFDLEALREYDPDEVAWLEEEWKDENNDEDYTTRFVALVYGDDAGGHLTILRTNAPVSELEKLEVKSRKLSFGWTNIIGWTKEMKWVKALVNEAYLCEVFASWKICDPEDMKKKECLAVSVAKWIEMSTLDIKEIHYLDEIQSGKP